MIMHYIVCVCIYTEEHCQFKRNLFPVRKHKMYYRKYSEIEEILTNRNFGWTPDFGWFTIVEDDQTLVEHLILVGLP